MSKFCELALGMIYCWCSRSSRIGSSGDCDANVSIVYVLGAACRIIVLESDYDLGGNRVGLDVFVDCVSRVFVLAGGRGPRTYGVGTYLTLWWRSQTNSINFNFFSFFSGKIFQR